LVSPTITTKRPCCLFNSPLRREKEESQQLHQEAWERHHSRKELRVRNQNIADGRPEEAFFSRLDSSLKKNTAFVKKLRTLTEQQRDSLSNDFGALNLSKVRWRRSLQAPGDPLPSSSVVVSRGVSLGLRPPLARRSAREAEGIPGLSLIF